MLETANKRNITMLKQFLGGKSYQELADESNYSSQTSAYQCVVSALKLLNTFGPIDVPTSGAVEILHKNKDLILEAIKKTKYPKTTIIHRAHLYLLEKYGKRYPHKAKQVAADWPEVIDKHFSKWGDKRERNSILGWLASEGYFLDNFLDAEHKRILFSGVIDMLNNKNSKQQGNTIVMGDLEHSSFGGVVADITIKGDKVTAQRRIRIELMDA